jgi:DNA-binding transcriptional ArsR family regulator
MVTDFALVGAALASRARSAMLNAMLEAEPVPAGELARIARVSPSTATEHLSALLRGGMVRSIRTGRHHRFTLANADVANALEALARISPQLPPRSLGQSLQADAFRFARMCYDHVAGSLGVAILDRFVMLNWLSLRGEEFLVRRTGEKGFENLGIRLAALRQGRRAFAKACLDVTERRPHLAGALGAALARRMVEQGWIERIPGSRAIRLRPQGRVVLSRKLGLDMLKSSPR